MSRYRRQAPTLESSSNSSFFRASRYNLRNCGPPIFAQLEELECPVCLSEEFEKPVVVNCGHTFCGPCIRLCLTKSKKCPLCSQVLIEPLFLSNTSFTRNLAKPPAPVPTATPSVKHCQVVIDLMIISPSSLAAAADGRGIAIAKKSRRTVGQKGVVVPAARNDANVVLRRSRF